MTLPEDTPIYTPEDALSLPEKIVMAFLGIVGLLCAVSPAIWDLMR